MAFQNDSTVSFKDTLNLPRTDFPIRADAAQHDPIMIKRWHEEHLDHKTFVHNDGKKKFILHDGPPYANGHIHIGHAYNKILKDIVTKSQRMFGNHVPVTPGWDCHGLPIELKVSTEYPHLDPVSLKKACREYAQKWINIQKEEFKKLGVLMDWEHPYLTMNYGYEAEIIRSFGTFVQEGYIERKNKTVPWCPSCQTVLASAEIEYEDRKDPSIYVLFPLTHEARKKIAPSLSEKEVSLLIWTTTPWTLPLNRAVLLKPDTEYTVIEVNGQYVVLGASLVDALCAAMGVEKTVIATFNSDVFAGERSYAYHPFINDLQVPIILDQSVLVAEGTACVHSAPGAGPEDYEVGVKNNLEIYSPVAGDGRYTNQIVPQELTGMTVADGQIWVIKKLAELNKLLYKTSIRHSYPHCWRCHNGLIFRATKQWFCDLSKNDLKERTLEAADGIATYPEKSINRLKATIEGRLEWCLSRQRVWGVPITALLCAQCDKPYITKQLLDIIADHVAQEGVEWWDKVLVDDVKPAGLTCACGSTSFEKETDILDVWFDSGISHEAVLKKNPALAYPADLYLEGKDQHRGWFQSSLLTSMVLSGTPSMKAILTHGFTVDDKGRKMSKSLGNVVSPQEMVDKLGTDGVRLWASSIDGSGEAVVSEKLTQNVAEVFRKVRNTARFLLSNLYDFDSATDAIPLEKLRLIDQYALRELFVLNYQLLKAYEEYDFTAVYHMLGDYCASDLSALYLDIIKDRLYVEKADSYARRSAQTVVWYILDTLTRLMAPILSFTAEQVSDLYEKNKKVSIHLQDFARLQKVAIFLEKHDEQLEHLARTVKSEMPFDEMVASLSRSSFVALKEGRWQLMLTMRSAFLKAIEELRAQGTVKHSLEARITYFIEPGSSLAQVVESFKKDLANTDQDLNAFLKEFVIVSQVVMAAAAQDLQKTAVDGLFVRVEHARGVKCPRCWHWDETEHVHGLCQRCQKIV